jgi:butyryl-CoA dehydrogenase
VARRYEPTREQEEFRRSVREFAEAEIGPQAGRWDCEHHLPVDVVRKMEN